MGGLSSCGPPGTWFGPFLYGYGVSGILDVYLSIAVIDFPSLTHSLPFAVFGGAVFQAELCVRGSQRLHILLATMTRWIQSSLTISFF
jgi:hypothetical protein